MSTYDDISTVSVELGATTTIYSFVQLQTDGKYDPVGSAQGRADGIAAEGGADGDTVPMVKPDGSIAKVELGATVTRGAQVASDNAGKAIAHVDTAGNYILGTFLEAGDDGDIVRIQFGPVHQDGA